MIETLERTMQPKTIWIVNPYDPIPGDDRQLIRYPYVAEELSKRGHKVILWTSTFSHITKKQRLPLTLNHKLSYKINRIHAPSYKSNTSLGRLWNHILFETRFYINAIRSNEKPDLILASIPPLLAPWIAMRLARKWNAVGVLDIQDLWPEAFVSMFPRVARRWAHGFLLPFYCLRNNSVKHAAAVTGVSKTYAAAVAIAYSNTLPTAFPLGADISAYDLKPPQTSTFPAKQTGERWFLRAGMVGHFCDNALIIKAAEQLKLSHPGIKIVIAGSGSSFPEIKQYKNNLGLFNLLCLERPSPEDMLFLHREADATLCLYKDSAPQSLVNKAFASMAAGKPIINSVSGEMAELVEQERIGINYKAGDTQAFIHAVTELATNDKRRHYLGRNARKLAEERYDKRVVYSNFADWLCELIGDTSGA